MHFENELKNVLKLFAALSDIIPLKESPSILFSIDKDEQTLQINCLSKEPFYQKPSRPKYIKLCNSFIHSEKWKENVLLI